MPKVTANCARIEPLLPLYVARALDAKGRAQVIRHLAQCPACREEAALWLSVADVFAKQDAAPPEAALVSAFDRLPASTTPLKKATEPIGEALALAGHMVAFSLKLASI